MSTVKRIFAKVSSHFNTCKVNHEKLSRQGDFHAVSQPSLGQVNANDTDTNTNTSTESERAREVKEKQREAYEQDPLRENYGEIKDDITGLELMKIYTFAEKKAGDHVRFRARIHHIRAISPKMVFLVFRQQLTTFQGIISENDHVISENMIRWSGHLRRESIVVVEGILQTPGPQNEVKDATIHTLEVNIHKLHLVAGPSTTLPFQIVDGSRPLQFFEENAQLPHITDRTRLQNRILELRTPTSQAIFRIHSGITKLFREFLDSQSFLEISSSKLQGSATESGASVFKVDYFRRPAYLAQSPQLAKQMCIAADMERVYEIGPVFRAENSNTHRHLTEFIGLDLEMTIESNYTEVLDMLDNLLLHIFRGLQSRYRTEIEAIKLQFPHEDLVFAEKTVRLDFVDGIKMLTESGWKEEDGSDPSELEDLSTKAEQQLGRLVKEKYNTDYFILDKFPLAARPFYTMPNSTDQRFSNSFDIFLRGEEILSGGQRIHLASELEQRMHDINIDPDSMKEYLDGFRWACPPHGGGGLGLERVLMLFANLGDVRWGSLFPRDPKSFTAPGKDPEETAAEAAQAAIMKGPTTLKNEHGELPPLENLIAKYGDSTNTCWIDSVWEVWRHEPTGGAVGFIAESGYAVTFGNPLCTPDQLSRVVKAYIKHIKRDRHLKPVWCCVGPQVQDYFAQTLGWSAVMAVAEERLDPTELDVDRDRNLKHKIHRAEREHVKIHEIEGEPDQTFRENVQRRIGDWQAARKGAQVHLTGVHPFDDMAHRRYYYAKDKEGTICCLVVLAQLTSKRGFQIKWALEFPGAPGGAIEYILAEVIKKLGDAGIRQATFGAGATDELRKVSNIGGFRYMMLEKAYTGLSRTFPLFGKGDFRQKFGVYHDPLYICYPKGSLGLNGINAIMRVLQKPK